MQRNNLSYYDQWADRWWHQSASIWMMWGQRSIAQVSRVLKPGGYFCFDTINRTWQSKLVMYIGGANRSSNSMCQ